MGLRERPPGGEHHEQRCYARQHADTIPKVTPLRWSLVGAAAALLACLAVGALLLTSWDGPDTYYSAGFISAAFDGLAPGASREAAEAALGTPMSVVCGDDRSEVWKYSESATGAASYVHVSLRFGGDGLLAEKTSEVVREAPTWPGRTVVLPPWGAHAVGACSR